VLVVGSDLLFIETVLVVGGDLLFIETVLAVGGDLLFRICGYTGVMIVSGVEGDTSVFRLPKYINISLTLNIAISCSRLQGAENVCGQ
jgi:hypothetical protein